MADDVPVPKFSEAYGRGKAYPSARSVKIDDVVGKEIEIIEYTERPSKFKDRKYVVVRAYQGAEELSFGTGSEPIIQQLGEMRAKGVTRFRTTPVKLKDYYRLSAYLLTALEAYRMW